MTFQLKVRVVRNSRMNNSQLNSFNSSGGILLECHAGDVGHLVSVGIVIGLLIGRLWIWKTVGWYGISLVLLFLTKSTFWICKRWC